MTVGYVVRTCAVGAGATGCAIRTCAVRTRAVRGAHACAVRTCSVRGAVRTCTVRGAHAGAVRSGARDVHRRDAEAAEKKEIGLRPWTGASEVSHEDTKATKQRRGSGSARPEACSQVVCSHSVCSHSVCSHSVCSQIKEPPRLQDSKQKVISGFARRGGCPRDSRNPRDPGNPRNARTARSALTVSAWSLGVLAAHPPAHASAAHASAAHAPTGEARTLLLLRGLRVFVAQIRGTRMVGAKRHPLSALRPLPLCGERLWHTREHREHTHVRHTHVRHAHVRHAHAPPETQ